MNHGKPPSAAAVRAQRVLSIRWQRSETRYCSDTLLRHNPRCRGSRLRAAHMQALPSPSSLREARRRGRTSRVHRSRSASSSRRTASGTPRPSQFGGLRRPPPTPSLGERLSRPPFAWTAAGHLPAARLRLLSAKPPPPRSSAAQRCAAASSGATLSRRARNRPPSMPCRSCCPCSSHPPACTPSPSSSWGAVTCLLCVFLSALTFTRREVTKTS